MKSFYRSGERNHISTLRSVKGEVTLQRKPKSGLRACLVLCPAAAGLIPSLLVLVFILAPSSRAQIVSAGIPVGVNPVAMIFNPVTKKIYAANQGTTITPGTTLTVIDTGTWKANDIPIGNNPGLVAVNPLTNKVYVGNNGDQNIAVLDGSTNNITTTINVLAAAIAINPVTNKVYAAGRGVTVIDGTTDTVEQTILELVGGFQSVAVNPMTNIIYAANTDISSLTVINGATNQVTATVQLLMDFGNRTTMVRPSLLAVNSVTNKVYIGLEQGVMVLDGATNTATQIFAPVLNGSTDFAKSISINSVTNKIYVGFSAGFPPFPANDVIAEIDGVTNVETLISVGNVPSAVAVDVFQNKIYAANTADGTVTIIDGTTHAQHSVSVGKFPVALGVDTLTGDAYVLNQNWQLGMNTPPVAGTVQKIAGVTGIGNATISAGLDPFAVDVDPALNKAYVANYGSNDVTVIDGLTNTATTIPAGTNPYAVAVDPITNKAFVANQGSNTITAIDGRTGATTTISVGNAPEAVAVNPVTGTVYVANSRSNSVTAINEATNSTVTVPTGSSPVALAVNPATNMVYVADQGSNDVTVINGTTNATSTIPAGSSPGAVGVDPATNRIYVANMGSDDVTAIDGATGTTSRIPVGTTPVAVAVNPVTNKIYVVNKGSNDVNVIDGASLSRSSVTVGFFPLALAINLATNKIYVAGNGDNDVTVIDGANNSTNTVPGGTSPVSLAVNPVTGKIYVADLADEATVISGQPTQPTHLVTQIAPLTGNIATTPAPTFTFTTSSSYAPTAPPALGVFYQVDTLQGPWLAGSGSEPNFTGQTQPLTFGTHIVYAYALDGQASLVNGQLSGLYSAAQYTTGSLTAYVFALAPTSSQTSLTSDKNPSQVGDTVNFTAVVAAVPPATATPTGVVDFMDGAVLLGSAALDSAGHATYTTSTLTAGTHQVTARYDGDSTFASSTSAVFTQTVNENFTVTSSTNTLTIKAGKSGDVTLTVTPVGGAAGSPISFSCTGLPSGSTCRFNPPNVTPGSSAATTVLTIQTAGSALVALPFDVPALPPGLMLLLYVAIGVGTTLRDARRMRLRWVRAACLSAVLGLVAFTLGCGGGTSGAGVPPPNAATGNFTVTVHAKSGSVDKTTTIALTVN